MLFLLTFIFISFVGWKALTPHLSSYKSVWFPREAQALLQHPASTQADTQLPLATPEWALQHLPGTAHMLRAMSKGRNAFQFYLRHDSE